MVNQPIGPVSAGSVRRKRSASTITQMGPTIWEGTRRMLSELASMYQSTTIPDGVGVVMW